MEWKYIGDESVARKFNALVLPGHKCKVYKMGKDGRAIAWFTDGNDQMKLHTYIIMNTDKDETTYELALKILNCRHFEPTTVVSSFVGRSVLKRVFNLRLDRMAPGAEMDVRENTKIVSCEGSHAIFRMPTKFLTDNFIGRSKTSIGIVVPGIVARMNNVRLAIATLYPSLKSMKDVDEAQAALSFMTTFIKRVESNHYETEKFDASVTLDDLRSELKTKEDELAKVCNKSADALNTLSEKYGIEVEL